MINEGIDNHNCRRSKEAFEKLLRLGYTNNMEFGGILDWTDKVVKRSQESMTDYHHRCVQQNP